MTLTGVSATLVGRLVTVLGKVGVIADQRDGLLWVQFGPMAADTVLHPYTRSEVRLCPATM